mmetsp:Transcript_31538/g.5696  ORF Transcript_31538/g.5696 Transcript_31538/m.5696 type:complete len:121 (+) Transcript_31538:81-443(+)
MQHAHGAIIYNITPSEIISIVQTLPHDSTYQDILPLLPPDEPRFIAYDAHFKNDEGHDRNKLVFIHWSPETCPVPRKMIYATCKENFKRKLSGININLQAVDMGDLDYDDLLNTLKRSTS